MGENWNPDDFKHNKERSSNAGDQTVVLLRKLTGSQDPVTPFYTRLANIHGEAYNSLITTSGEQTSVERYIQFDVRPVFGVSDIRDVTGSISGGTVQHTDREYRLDTPNSASSLSYLESAQHGHYVPGLDMMAIVAVRIPNPSIGSQVFKWGYFDDQEGMYFGQDITGSFVAVEDSGSIIKKVYQSDWNLDKLDGSGSTGYDLSQFADSGHIYSTRFLWHGYGYIEWIVSTFVENNLQIDVPIHRERVTGSVSISNPHLPVRIQIENNDTPQSASIFTTCRSVAVYGSYKEIVRSTSEIVIDKTVNDTSYQPIISFKRASIDKDVANISIDGIDILSNKNLVWQIRQRPQFLSQSVFDVPSTVVSQETTLLSDISASSITGGITIAMGLVEGGGSGPKRTVSKIDLPTTDLILTEPITLVAKSFAGSATVTAIFSVKENW